MEINIEDNFSLLFDKNNNTAYKALQTLQKECEESDEVYCYMDKLADMIDNDNSYIRTRGLTPDYCALYRVLSYAPTAPALPPGNPALSFYIPRSDCGLEIQNRKIVGMIKNMGRGGCYALYFIVAENIRL